MVSPRFCLRPCSNMQYWEVVADKLSAAGWSWGYCSAILSRAKREAWPGDALSCFAFSDDYSFGILQSGIHWSWFIATCSKLKGDFRYTPESVFDTFPWPQKPKHEDIKAVAEAAVTLRALRQETMRKLNYSLPARAIFCLVFSV